MDLRGEKLFSGDIEEMCSRMVAREAGWKILGLSNLVMSRVFDGGAGEDRGGSEERSIDSGERGRLLDIDDGDAGGELFDLVCMGEGWGCSVPAMIEVGVERWF